jgi:hypothetical protein
MGGVDPGQDGDGLGSHYGDHPGAVDAPLEGRFPPPGNKGREDAIDQANPREKFTYTPLYWSMVFPLGMYTVCIFRLSQISGLEILCIIPPYLIYFALLAWMLAFTGLMRRVWITVKQLG